MFLVDFSIFLSMLTTLLASVFTKSVLFCSSCRLPSALKMIGAFRFYSYTRLASLASSSSEDEEDEDSYDYFCRFLPFWVT